MNSKACKFLSFVVLVTGCLLCTRGSAEIRLPHFFGDHMVVQQEMPIKVWGWSNPNERITVEFGNTKAESLADGAGQWSIKLPAMKASKQPKLMRITGNQSPTPLELKDILIGEVWLCSGQSNMEWSVEASANAKEEIANANHPLIRHIKVPRLASALPLSDIGNTQWEVCSPKTAAAFTATGYYAARTLAKELDVPVGLINSSWGGTRVEPWTATGGLEQVPALKDLYQLTMQRSPGTPQHVQRMKQHVEAINDWSAKATEKIGKAELTPASPGFPNELRPLSGSSDPTALYNGMIHPLVGIPIRGALWYQGESNRSDGMSYFEKKKALIQGWRQLWGQGDFPFLFVQIAPFQYNNESPEVLAEFWEAQSATLSVPNTGMVVINDIATLNDIHPPNKQDVGKRLANLALKDVYGRENLDAHSPVFESLEILPGKLKVNFKSAGDLKTRDQKPPTLFEIIGPKSNGFQPADAKIEGKSVILSSSAVAAPTAFRFAWNKLAEPNLTGANGLPVGAVRGGEVPTFLEMIPDISDFELVYDLDLAKLGPSVQYATNRSADVKNFSRIAYFLELDSPSFGQQKVFVSFDAFTSDAKKIGVPTPESSASFQQPVKNLRVFSSTKGNSKVNQSIDGNIEFWPNNYAQTNTAQVPGASDSIYDFGDSPYGASEGYGSMQVHNTTDKQTIFAINHWRQGSGADIGIGNSAGPNRDWTFTRNADTYHQKRLRVLVKK